MTTNDTPKGLLLTVWRAAGRPDLSLGGVTAAHDRLIVVGTKRHGEPVKPLPARAQVFEPDFETPAVVLVESMASESYGPHLAPLDGDGKPREGLMFGGSYAGTSDSRWAALGRDVFGHDRLDVVSVHDRDERERFEREAIQ